MKPSAVSILKPISSPIALLMRAETISLTARGSVHDLATQTAEWVALNNHNLVVAGLACQSLTSGAAATANDTLEAEDAVIFAAGLYLPELIARPANLEHARMRHVDDQAMGDSARTRARRLTLIDTTTSVSLNSKEKR